MLFLANYVRQLNRFLSLRFVLRNVKFVFEKLNQRSGSLSNTFCRCTFTGSVSMHSNLTFPNNGKNRPFNVKEVKRCAHNKHNFLKKKNNSDIVNLIGIPR